MIWIKNRLHDEISERKAVAALAWQSKCFGRAKGIRTVTHWDKRSGLVAIGTGFAGLSAAIAQRTQEQSHYPGKDRRIRRGEPAGFRKHVVDADKSPEALDTCKRYASA